MNSGVNIKLVDSRGDEEVLSELSSRGGLKGYVKFLDKSREAIVDDIFFFKVLMKIFLLNVPYNGTKVTTNIS